MEKSIPTVFLYGFELIDEETVDRIHDIETPLIYVEHIKNFKENLFWLKIRNIWVLVGKIPPLSIEEGDIVFFKERKRWGLFRYVGKEKDKVVLEDVKGERKTRVSEEILNEIELFGKVIRVQEKV